MYCSPNNIYFLIHYNFLIMKKSTPILSIGYSFLIGLFFLFHIQNIVADNPLNCACIGNDTLICDFTYQITPTTAGGQWSVLCDSTDGSVDFDMIDLLTTQITVSDCGDYHLIYTVDDGICMSADTAVFTFGNPSFGGTMVESEADLEYDGTVFCHQSPPPSSCNPVSTGGGPSPSVSWNFCGEGTSFATIFSTDVQGDMPTVCLADEITINSTNFNAAADLGCMNLSEAEFLDQFLALLNASCLPVADSLGIPFPVACLGIGQVDTIYNDSISFDTIIHLIPYRVGGQWNYVMDDGQLTPLNDTTDIVVNDSSLILIVNPGSDYYGPGDIEWSVFVENDMMDWVDPTYDIEMMVQWVEEFAYDTLLQITQTDSIEILTQTCHNFSFSNNFSLSGPPSYPCGPITLQFNFETPPEPLVANLLFASDDFCFYCTGEAYLDVQGGCPPYSQTEFFGLCEGSYSFTITDANGNESNPVNVDIFGSPPPFIANTIVIDDECEQNIGSITVEAFDGFPPYIYFVNGEIQSDNTFTGLSAGTYSIDVMDSNGCIGFSSATVNTTFAPNVSISGNMLICPGDFTTLFADSDAIDFQWSTGDNTSSISVSSPGDYCVTVTNQEGCTAETCAVVSQDNADIPDITGNLEVCPGEQTTLTATSGFSNYLWDTGSTDLSISVGAGNYCVTVTNFAGCTAVNCVTVTETNNIPVNIIGNLEICPGEQTTLDVDGNFDSYLWDNGSTDPSITVGEGTYCVTVTNGNGCTGEACVTVTETDNILVSVIGNFEICPGEQAFLDVDGNFDSYQWDNGSTNPSILVGEGTYCVTVTNSNGCTGEACATVTETNAIDVNISGNTEICDGELTTITANGNFATAEWDNGDTGSSITVGAGTYCIIVTNNNGCTGQDCITVTETVLPPLNVFGDLEICEGNSGNIFADGGFDTYQWDNGDFGQNIVVFNGGIYCVTATIGNCIANACWDITEIPNPNPVIAGDTEIPTGGSVTLSTDVYNSYLWSNSETTANITITEAGTYCVTVTNGNGCIGEDCIIVTESTPNLSPTIAGNLVFCENENTTLALNGNYATYLWSNGETTPTISITEGGTYSVTVTDNNGNTGTTSEIVIENTLPIINASASNDIDCIDTESLLSGEGSETGQNISYDWQNTQGISISDNLNFSTTSSGTYALVVTNLDNNCAATQEVVITENTTIPELILAVNQTLPCDGAMEISPMNIPAVNYTYDWSNSDGNPIAAATTATPSVEIAGTYEVLITDANNGCTNTNQIAILANESKPTGAELSLQNPTCFGDANGEIIIENVIEGDGPFLFAINGGAFSENMNFENLPAGSFELSIESQVSGCVYSEMVTINEGDQVNVDLGGDLTVNLGETIEVGATFIDESIVENIVWATTAEIACDTCLNNSFLLLENTAINLTVTSENGCVASDEIQILVEDNTEVYAPNVFSPNNDGVNDRFTIYSNNAALNITKLTVFDRWGSLVFETSNVSPNEEDLGWDGQFNGKIAQNGLYIYMAEVEYLDGRTGVMKGDVLVLGSN